MDIPLAFLPIESIVADPIDYLQRGGPAIEGFDYAVLSDFGLGAPVIRYCVRRREQTQTFIAKWHAPAEGMRIAALLRALWDAGFARAPYLIPEPLAYIAERHILLQRPAEGVPLLQYLDATQAALVPVARAAEWLAKLHMLPLAAFGALITQYTLAPAAQMVDAHARALCELLPAHARRIASIAAASARQMSAANARALQPTHGDFHPKNIYVEPACLTVIDFDRFAFDHAERDVAYFLAQSMTMAYTPAAGFARTHAWHTTFLDAYQRAAAPLDPSLLRAYFGAAFLEILFYRLCVRPVAERGFVPAWLDACERGPCAPGA